MISNEQAKWSLAVNQAMAKYRQKINESLADAATRGFSTPGGGVLRQLVEAGQEIKTSLVAENGKILTAQLADIESLKDALDKYALEIAKLELLRHKAFWLDRIEQEKQEYEELVEKNKADLTRKEATIEGRMANIIWQKAILQVELNKLHLANAGIEREAHQLEVKLANLKKTYAVEQMRMLEFMQAEINAELVGVQFEVLRQDARRKTVEAIKKAALTKSQQIPYVQTKAKALEESARLIPQAAEVELKKKDFEAKYKVFEAQLKRDRQIKAVDDTLAYLWGVDDKKIIMEVLDEVKPTIIEAKRRNHFYQRSGIEYEDMYNKVKMQDDNVLRMEAIDNITAIGALERQLKIELPHTKRLNELERMKEAHRAEGVNHTIQAALTVDQIATSAKELSEAIEEGAVLQRSVTHLQDQQTQSTISSVVNLQRTISKG